MPEPVSRLLRVFLCHSSDDKPTVRTLCKRLNGEGWIDVWLDEEKLLPGQDWDYEIEKALDNSDAVIVTLSTGSVSKEGYVQKELRFVLEIALEKPEGTIFILPVRLDDCERPRRLRSIQGIDYFPKGRRNTAYQRLLESLRLRATHLGIPTNKVAAKQEVHKTEENLQSVGGKLLSVPPMPESITKLEEKPVAEKQITELPKSSAPVREAKQEEELTHDTHTLPSQNGISLQMSSLSGPQIDWQSPRQGKEFTLEKHIEFRFDFIDRDHANVVVNRSSFSIATPRVVQLDSVCPRNTPVPYFTSAKTLKLAEKRGVLLRQGDFLDTN